MFLTFASWLHRTPLSLLFQQNAGWLWPLCETLHFAGLALLIGVAGMFDLRLLGFMKNVPVSSVKSLMPWALVGFAMNVLTGTIFLITNTGQYFGNYTWWLKVVFLLIAGVNALVFETNFGQRAAALPVGEDTPLAMKLIGAVSLITWFAVLWAGRMLPFIKAGPAARL